MDKAYFAPYCVAIILDGMKKFALKLGFLILIVCAIHGLLRSYVKNFVNSKSDYLISERSEEFRNKSKIKVPTLNADSHVQDSGTIVRDTQRVKPMELRNSTEPESKFSTIDVNADGFDESDKYDPFVEWDREKIDFYRDELKLSDDEIGAINGFTEDAGAAITNLIDEYNRNIDQGHVEPRFVPNGTDRIVDDYQSKVLSIMGPDRYERTVEFREAFNDRSKSLYGVEHRLNRF